MRRLVPSAVSPKEASALAGPGGKGSLLAVAAGRGHAEVVAALLDLGVVERRHRLATTAAMVAANRGQVLCLLALAERDPAGVFAYHLVKGGGGAAAAASWVSAFTLAVAKQNPACAAAILAAFPTEAVRMDVAARSRIPRDTPHGNLHPLRAAGCTATRDAVMVAFARERSREHAARAEQARHDACFAAKD